MSKGFAKNRTFSRGVTAVLDFYIPGMMPVWCPRSTRRQPLFGLFDAEYTHERDTQQMTY